MTGARSYNVTVITFRVRRSRRALYIGHGRLCVCVSVCLSRAAFPRYWTDPDVSWVNGTGCPVVVYVCADLQSVHGFCCYDNTAPNAKCQRVLVLALCLVPFGKISYCANVFTVCLYVRRSLQYQRTADITSWCDNVNENWTRRSSCTSFTKRTFFHRIHRSHQCNTLMA